MAGLNEAGIGERDPITVPDAVMAGEHVTWAVKAIPVWVRFTFDDGRPERTEKGFAKAWTTRYVLVQVLWQLSYYRGAREFWIDADRVCRRQIEPTRIGWSA